MCYLIYFSEKVFTFLDILKNVVSRHNAFQGLEYLPDLAQLEWNWHVTHSAAAYTDTGATVTDNDVSSLSPLLNTSLLWMSTPYPVLDIWQQHRRISGRSPI